MESVSISSYRDRTSEFQSFAERLKKTTGNDEPAAKAADDAVSRPEFNKKVSSIGLAIHDTSEKIARLAKIAKRSSMFDDPALEIQELSALIKNVIATLNVAVSDLQILQNTEISESEYSSDRVVHATTICDDLKSKLMRITKLFRDVLTIRTENIKAYENRKQIFSANSSKENPLLPRVKAATEPPPWSNVSVASSTSQSLIVPTDGIQNRNQLRQQLGAESIPSHHMEMFMLQPVVPGQESYTRGQAVAFQNIDLVYNI